MNEPSRIAVLTSALADQIAAGEVVERPASVVKELVENAVDAGATRVEVELEDGGKTLIRVSDDGSGIHPDDLRLTVTRHATSKVRAPEDLIDIATLGFRGEALASLAAVSRLRLRSRIAGSELGYELMVVPGEVDEERPVGMPLGTQIEAKDLFFNVPARLKFLRNEATEVGHCVDAVLKCALVHPAVAFRLRHQRRELLDLPAGSESSRIQAVLGRRCDGPFFEISGAEGTLKMHGWFARPGAVARPGQSLYLVVRRRVVKDRNVAQLVRRAFESIGENVESPIGVLVVEPGHGEVDVNVHPQKSEVRFSDAVQVYAALRETLVAEFAARPWESKSDDAAVEAISANDRTLQSMDQFVQHVAAHPEAYSNSRAEDRRAENRTRQSLPDVARAKETPIGSLATPRPIAASVQRETPFVASPAGASSRYRLGTRATEADYEAHKSERRSEVETLRQLNAPRTPEQPLFAASANVEQARPEVPRHVPHAAPEPRASASRDISCEPAESSGDAQGPAYLTCLAGGVAIFLHEECLFAVDLQRLRAHLVRQRLLKELGGNGVSSQRLLLPVVLSASEADVEIVSQHQPALRRLGLEIDAFGEASLVIRGLPASIAEGAGEPEATRLLSRVMPWLRLHAQSKRRDADQFAQSVGIHAAEAQAVDAIVESTMAAVAPKLARRWVAELWREGTFVDAPGVRRWRGAELAAESKERK